MIDVVFPQKPLRKWQPRAGQDGSFQPTFVGFHIAFAVLFTTETRVVWDPVLGQGMARLDVDDELKGVDGWCVVRGWLFQHRIVFVSFCLTPVGPWCFFISIWCYSMYSFPNWFRFRVLYNLCFDLVASAHVHPPHTDMQRHNMNSRGVKLSPWGIRGKINWSLRLVVY